MGQVVTLIIFVAVYAGLAAGDWHFFKLDRTGIALLGAIAMLAFGCITLPQAVSAVSMPSILLLFSLMVITSQLHFAGFYGWIADKALNPLLACPPLFLGVLIGLGGLLAAFLNNNVVVLALAPVITISLLKRRIDPAPFLIALALAANIGCALTIIGNAQNVMVGELAKLSFAKYMMFAAAPVGASLAACYGIVYSLGFAGRATASRPAVEHTLASCLGETPSPCLLPFNAWRTIKGVGVLVALVVLFVASPWQHYMVAMVGAGLLLCSRMLPSRNVLQLVNWQLLVLFIGLYVVVGAFEHSGLADRLLQRVASVGVDVNHPLQLAVISGILSNSINNAATVMLLVNVVDLTQPINAYALALSNAFAGNLLIVGSLANITAVQCAEEFGVKISFREFFRYGAPTALASMIILLAWLWLLM